MGMAKVEHNSWFYLVALPVGAKEKVDHVPQGRVSEEKTASPYSLLWNETTNYLPVQVKN